jgi:hypothetical protein
MYCSIFLCILYLHTVSSQVKVLEERLKEESLRALKLKGIALQSSAPIDKMPASSIFDQAIKVRHAQMFIAVARLDQFVCKTIFFHRHMGKRATSS